MPKIAMEKTMEDGKLLVAVVVNYCDNRIDDV